MKPSPHLSRRGLLLSSAGLFVACSSPARTEQARSAAPLPLPLSDAASVVPSRGAAPPSGALSRCAPTAANIEGPFYRPGAPERARLAEGVGTLLRVEGQVRDEQCRPVPFVELDLWHADANGAYDHVGFAHRGRLRCDERGRYQLETIVPGRYLNGSRYRPAHIHVKLTAAGMRPLTTQLYFPDDPHNDGDPFIDRSLIMAVRDVPSFGRAARFDFVMSSA